MVGREVQLAEVVARRARPRGSCRPRSRGRGTGRAARRAPARARAAVPIHGLRPGSVTSSAPASSRARFERLALALLAASMPAPCQVERLPETRFSPRTASARSASASVNAPLLATTGRVAHRLQRRRVVGAAASAAAYDCGRLPRPPRLTSVSAGHALAVVRSNADELARLQAGSSRRVRMLVDVRPAALRRHADFATSASFANAAASRTARSASSLRFTSTLASSSPAMSVL